MTVRDDDLDAIRNEVEIHVHRWMLPTDRIEDADIVQTAFAEAIRGKLLNGLPFADAVLLLLTIAKRRLKNHRRDQGRQRRDRHREDGGVDLTGLVRDQETILEEIFDRERKLELWSLVDALTPAQREVIHLRFEDGLGVTEIARRTRRTAPSVTRLIVRAIRQLRKTVEGLDE